MLSLEMRSPFRAAAAAAIPSLTEEALDGMLHLPEIAPRQIRLSTDPVENQQLRDEFYYEQVCIGKCLPPQTNQCVQI